MLMFRELGGCIPEEALDLETEYYITPIRRRDKIVSFFHLHFLLFLVPQTRIISEKRQKILRKEMEQIRHLLARLKTPVNLQDKWRKGGHNKTDYMLLDFSK